MCKLTEDDLLKTYLRVGTGIGHKNSSCGYPCVKNTDLLFGFVFLSFLNQREVSEGETHTVGTLGFCLQKRI